MSNHMPTRAPNTVSSSPVAAGTPGPATGAGGRNTVMATAPSIGAGFKGGGNPTTLVSKTMKTGHGAGAKKGVRETFLGGSRPPGHAVVAKV